MKLRIVGCSHHDSSVEVRERLAFSPEQARSALELWRTRHPHSEAVLLSTCNRTEMYVAAENAEACPTRLDVVQFMADFHGLDATGLDALYQRSGLDAVRHLFMVAASLDSMVVGEAQILSQVKQAYELALAGNNAGTLMHLAFQAASRVAKRVQRETSIHQRRVSIPSVAVADFASQIFENFDDKHALVAGAGEMAEETIRYLQDQGVQQISIVNRSPQRAQELAAKVDGTAAPWEHLLELMAEADLVIGTTGATEPIVTWADFRAVHARRSDRPLFMLDLAVPRDFDPRLAQCNEVYLYTIDDLKAACERNLQARAKEWPKAEAIVHEESTRFMAELHHRATGPTIRRLTSQANELKAQELQRLLNKIDLDDRQRKEVERAFDRLVNKLLHPPLESLRDEARAGSPQGLLDALRQLFRLADG